MFNVLDMHNKYTVRICISPYISPCCCCLFLLFPSKEYVGGGGGGGWGKLGRWGGGGGLLTWRAGQKCCFWALFGKLLHIGRPWMNVFVRVLQRRETLSLGPRTGKTAQKPLKNRSNLAWKPFKNHRKKWAVFERFLSGFLSKIWAVWAVFPKKPPKPPKPLKPLKSCWKTAQTAQILSGFWAVSRPG